MKNFGTILFIALLSFATYSDASVTSRILKVSKLKAPGAMTMYTNGATGAAVTVGVDQSTTLGGDLNMPSNGNLNMNGSTMNMGGGIINAATLASGPTLASNLDGQHTYGMVNAGFLSTPLGGSPPVCNLSNDGFLYDNWGGGTANDNPQICFEDNTGAFSWKSLLGGGSGASTSLNNLASTAVNVSILPGTTNSIALGSGIKAWAHMYSGVYDSPSSSTVTLQDYYGNSIFTGSTTGITLSPVSGGVVSFSGAKIYNTTEVMIFPQGAGSTPSCAAGDNGYVAITNAHVMCVCTGSSWVKVADGTTACTF